ncbi:hypothetical protein TYRP_010060 [Tyrophagus putrescentiae]|nr:hypothetical protein TYRP_010060 [Tyrophagus putrescentiae]
MGHYRLLIVTRRQGRLQQQHIWQSRKADDDDDDGKSLPIRHYVAMKLILLHEMADLVPPKPRQRTCPSAKSVSQ